jgi:tetratricopeptide (TPR) repeat protein
MRHWIVPALAFIAWAAGPAHAQPRASAAEIVSLEGKGEFRQPQQTAWRAAKAPQPLFADEFVRTLDLSKMSIVFSDRTRHVLSANSTMQIKGAAAPDGKTTIQLNNGRAWGAAKGTPRGLTIETPAATAAIRGTEWEIAVDDDGRATLSVFAGEVEFFNDQGRVVVNANEQAAAEKGKAPVKLQLRASRERVQWVSAYTVDANRYGTRPELADVASLMDEQRLSEAYARLKQRVAAGGPASAFLQLGDFEIYRGELAAADAVLKQGRARYPADERFDVALARVALFDDRSGALALAKGAVAKRGDSVDAWLALGDIERHEGHAKEALAAYARAAQLGAKDARGWRGLGIVESERENVRAARSHLEKAIALDPREASSLAELGTLESFAGDHDRARESLRKAIAMEPANYVAWTGLGVVELRAGNPEAAADALARAIAIEPRYARAHLYFAAAQYRLAGDAAALEELQRASELDPNDPLPHLLASMVYLDRIEPGPAADAAQRAVERLPYLKSLNPVATNQRGIGNAGYPLAQLGLEAWARSAAHESYLPSWGASHFFLSDRYAGDFDRRAELMQGFIADPLAFGASNRFQSLFVQPGHFGTISLRGDTSDDFRSYEGVVTLNGNGAGKVPYAYYAEVGDTHVTPGNTPFDASMRRFTGGVGVKPTHELGIFAYVNHFDADIDIGQPDVTGTTNNISGKTTRGDIGLGYAPNARSRLWIKGGAGEEDTTSTQLTRVFLPGQTLEKTVKFATRPHAEDVAGRYAYDWSDALELSLGAESSRIRNTLEVRQDAIFHLSDSAAGQSRLDRNDREQTDLAYAGARFRSGGALVEGLVGWHDYSIDLDTRISLDAAPGADTLIFERYQRRGTDGALGAAARVSPSALVRAACRRWLRPTGNDTLAPIAVAGMPLDDQLVLAGGEIDQCRLQGEWTFGRRTFATISFEHVETNNLVSPVYGILNTREDVASLERLRNQVLTRPAKPDELEGTPVYAGAVVRRANVALEHRVTQRVAARAYYTYTESRNNDPDPDFNGKRVPYLPRHLVNLGLTWVPGWWNSIVTVQAVHRTRRFTDEFNSVAFPAGWDGQVVFFIETPDKRWSLEAKALNLFKKEASDVFGAVLSYRF